MKLLTRYVLANFLKNYLISFFVLVGLYVVLDMVFNFDEIMKVQGDVAREGVSGIFQVAYDLWDFYFHQGFLFFAQLAGVIPGVAAAFTILRMTRFNELTAIMAAGVPLLRVAMPIVIAAVILSGLVVIDQEVFIPRMIPKLIRTHDNTRDTWYPIAAMQDADGAVLVVSRYYPPVEGSPATMHIVDVIRRDENMRPTTHTYAEAARWNPAEHRWDLVNGYTVANLQDRQTPTPPKPEPFYKSNINPEEIALFRSGDYVDMLSISRINELLQRPESYGQRDLLRVKHTRVAQWFMNVVMLLLAIPAVLTREPQTLKAAAIKSMALTATCLALTFVCGSLAGEPPPGKTWIETWPALMAWTPLFLFGPLSVWLLDRVKS